MSAENMTIACQRNQDNYMRVSHEIYGYLLAFIIIIKLYNCTPKYIC